MNDLELDVETKEKIIRLLLALFPNIKKIYLFGSRARGTNHDRSDIDIALDCGPSDSRLRLGEVKDVLNHTNILYKIDVVDFNAVPPRLKESILKEGVIWYQTKTE